MKVFFLQVCGVILYGIGLIGKWLYKVDKGTFILSSGASNVCCLHSGSKACSILVVQTEPLSG
jgi:hypothetical protein